MNGRKYKGPQILGARSLTTREEAHRVNLFVMKLGSRDRAAKELGVGLLTLEQAAREGGSMLTKTRAKLLEALARTEAA